MTVWADGTRTIPEISSPYGYSPDYVDSNGRQVFHGGTDFYGFGTNHAHEKGKVVFAGWTDFGDHGGGIEVAIQHDGWVSRILHNRSLLVAVGDIVAEGQPVGMVGGSGFGVQDYYDWHCHDEVRIGGRNGLTTDPVPFLRARIGSSSAGGDSRPFPDPELEEQEMASPTIAFVHSVDTSKDGLIAADNYFAIDTETGVLRLSSSYEVRAHYRAQQCLTGRDITADGWGELVENLHGDEVQALAVNGWKSAG